MRVLLKKGDQIIGEPIPTDHVMVRPTNKPKKTNLVVGIKRPNVNVEIISDSTRDANFTVNDNKKTMTVSIDNANTPKTNTISEIIKECNTWTPNEEVDTIDGRINDNIPVDLPTENIPSVDSDSNEDISTTTSIDENTIEEANIEDVSSDYFASNDEEHLEATDIDDDIPDMVFASDIELQRPKPRRNEKGQFMPSEDGPKRSKNKKKKNGTKSTFIPSGN